MSPTLEDHFLTERFHTAVSVVRSAGALALDYFQRASTLEVEHKGVQDLVSEADRHTESHITDALLTAFPEDSFVGEEHGFTQGGPGGGTWVVDPIDGTQPFLLGLPHWCVSIAYVFGSRVQLGCVYAPALGELYTGRAGLGASRNGSPMRVLQAERLSEGVTGVGCSSRTDAEELAEIMRRLLTAGGAFQRTGSGALNLAYVAAGHHIGYVERHIHAWDCLAAICLIEEAGGRVSTFVDDYGVQGAGPLVAGSPGVFDQLSGLLS